MKKYLLTLMVLLISAIGSINAKTYNPSAVINDINPTIMPNFAKDGKICLYDEGYSDDDTYMIFDIINEDFESFKITTVPLQKFEVKYYRQYGEFGEIEESKYTLSVIPKRYDILCEDGSQSRSHYLSYGFFGKEICYIMPIITKQEFSIETETYKEWGERAIRSGYNVYNSTNELICSIEVPQGFDGNDLYFAEMNGKKIIICCLYNINDDVSASAFYQIDENNNVSFVKMTEPKVSPRNPRQGERVTVSIDEQFAGENVSVNVVSADGQIVMKDRIRNGQSTLDIDTSRFKQGMYVVTVSGKGKTSEAAKIIVR